MTGPTLIGPVLDEVIDHLTIVELEQHLDDDVPCMVGHEGQNPHPAHWALRCPECDHDWHACHEHRLVMDRRAVGHRVYACDGPGGQGCGGDIPIPLNWRPL